MGRRWCPLRASSVQSNRNSALNRQENPIAERGGVIPDATQNLFRRYSLPKHEFKDNTLVRVSRYGRLLGCLIYMGPGKDVRSQDQGVSQSRMVFETTIVDH